VMAARTAGWNLRMNVQMLQRACQRAGAGAAAGAVTKGECPPDTVTIRRAQPCRLLLSTRWLAGLGQATQNDQFCWVAGWTSRLFSAPWPPARPRTSWRAMPPGCCGQPRPPGTPGKGWLRVEPHHDRHPEPGEVALRAGRLVSTGLGWTLTSGSARQPRPPGSLGRGLAQGVTGSRRSARRSI
jgi:hypothetical protein